MAFRTARFRGHSAPLIATVGLLVVVVLLSLITSGPHFIQVKANPSISIDADNLSPGDVRFFWYRDPAGDRIRFLLARDSGGRIKGAFDACRLCAMCRKGYDSSHGELICGYCGNRYKLDAMESGRGSCVPVKLPFRMTGHTVDIKPVDLELERGLF
jgi:uncharacterized membrane protein